MGSALPHGLEQGWLPDYDRFLEGGADLFVVVDSAARIVWLGEGWAEFANDASMHPGGRLTDIMSPKSAAAFRSALDGLVTGGAPGAVRAKCAVSDGWRWLRFSMARDDDGGIYCVARDDTSASSEEERLEAEMHLPLLAQHLAKIGFWKIDLGTGEVTWSDEAYRIRGIERGAHAPTLERIIESYHPNDRPVFIRHLEETVMTRRGFELDLRVVRPDGRQRTIRSLGRAQIEGDEVVALFGLSQDITDRKRTEAKLLAAQDELFAANDLLSGIVSATDEAILALDAAFNILIFNDAYADVMRRINGTVLEVGRNLLTLIDNLPEQRRQAEANFRRVLGGEAFSVTREYPDGAGGTLVLDLSYAPMRDENGAVIGLSIVARDVTERLRARQRLEESEARFRALTEESLQGVVIHRHFKPLFANRAYARIRGFEHPDEVLALPSLLGLVPEHVRGEALEKHQALLRAELNGFTVRHVEMRRDGTSTWVEVLGRRIEWNGEPAAQVTLVDISEQIEYERQLEAERAHFRQQAITDPLTGIANRRHFMALSKRELRRVRRYGRPVSFLIFDIDHFKLVNDSFGHAAGDEALRRIPEACASVLRASDVLGRLGGEEFAVLLPATPLREAGLVAERLRERIAEITVGEEKDAFGFTVSIGVAEWQGPADTLEGVLKRADSRLLEAKRTGRNRVLCADD